MTGPHTPLVKAGDIVRIAARDYLDGTAVAKVRIAWIGPGLDKIRGLEWVRILVTEPDQPDTEPRALVVRVNALRRPADPPGEQPEQQNTSHTEFNSASASYGRHIPSPRKPLIATTGEGEGESRSPHLDSLGGAGARR